MEITEYGVVKIATITPEDVVERYKKLGIKIFRGGFSPYLDNWSKFDPSACCGLGVVALDILGNDNYNDINVYDVFIEDEEDYFDEEDYVIAFGSGFDGQNYFEETMQFMDEHSDEEWAELRKVYENGKNCYLAAKEAGIPEYEVVSEDSDEEEEDVEE